MPAPEVKRQVTEGLLRGWRRLPESWRRTAHEQFAEFQATAGETSPLGPPAAEVVEPAPVDESISSEPTVDETAPEPGVEPDAHVEPVDESVVPTVQDPQPEETVAEESAAVAGPYFHVNEHDIHAAHRLLFFREPTEAEVDQHLKLAQANHEYDLYHFVDVMLSSPERADAVAGLAEPQAGSIDGMPYFYRPSDTALGATVAYTGTYEQDVAQAIEDLLPEGGTFIDVGANIGLHMLRGARAVGNSGTVVAFEPNPGNVELLTMSVEANRLGQVTIRSTAVGDRKGELPLHSRRGQSNGTAEVGDIAWEGLDLQITVPSVRLDDELTHLTRLDLVKIDIEGAEPMAFTGMAETLARFRPAILMEVFPDALRRTAGVEPVDFLRSIEDLGYHFFPMVPGRGRSSTSYAVEDIVSLPSEHDVTHVDVLAIYPSDTVPT